MGGLLAGTGWLAAGLLAGCRLATWLAAKSVSWLAAGLLAAWLVSDRLYQPTLPLLLFAFVSFFWSSLAASELSFRSKKTQPSRLNIFASQATSRLRKSYGHKISKARLCCEAFHSPGGEAPRGRGKRSIQWFFGFEGFQRKTGRRWRRCLGISGSSRDGESLGQADSYAV